MRLAIAAGSSFALGLVLVPTARWFAHRMGWVCPVQADRWSKREVALFGGAAIFAAYLGGLLISMPWSLNNSWSIPALGGILFLVGLVDDFLKIKPATKLIGQIVGAALAVYLGHQANLPWPILTVPISIFWIVALTNGYNLIDNMDGLAAGVGCVSLAFMAWVFVQEGNSVHAVTALSLLGALAAFLVYNFNPASIFMGDAGSLFIGFTLAILSFHSTSSHSAAAPIAVPFLILLVPVLDMTLVSATRILTGRSVAQGGKDHSSHRLVLLGLSERNAVLVLCGLAIAAGVAGILVKRFSTAASFLVLAGAVVSFALIGIYLSQMSFTGDKKPAAAGDGVTALMLDLTFKRRIFEVLLDLVLMSFCYGLAYSLRFDFNLPPEMLNAMGVSMPLVVMATFICFFIVGVYRGIWRFTGPRELFTLFTASGVATIVSTFLVVLIYRFEGFSRSVFPMYGMLLFFCVAASRLSFRALSGVIVSLRPIPENAVPALIYGAGDAGELLLRELRSRNGSSDVIPVGFIDDNAQKKHSRIHGLPVIGGRDALERAVKAKGIKQVLVSSMKIDGLGLAELTSFCKSRGIAVKRYRWVSEDLVD